MLRKLRVRELRKRGNRFLGSYGFHHGHTWLKNVPEIYSIELTNYCNLRCVMCPRGKPNRMDRPLGHMSAALLLAILEQGRYYCEPCWFHMFGEPLMNPELFDHIELAKKKGVPNIGISTNATLLDEDKARCIVSSSLDTLIISIDGISKATYEQTRISPQFTFEHVVNNARYFLTLKRRLGKKKPYTILSIIVMKHTANEIREFADYWKKLGADEIWEKPYTTWANQTDDFAQFATPDMLRPSRCGVSFPCQMLWSQVSITWDGKVIPCCQDYNAVSSMGDLNQQTMQEIWNGAKYQELRTRELEAGNDSPLCCRCPRGGQRRFTGLAGTVAAVRAVYPARFPLAKQLEKIPELLSP